MAENTNLTVIEAVTDENGETVTDASGEAVTEIFEEIPVTNSKGEQVTEASGVRVTQRVPATKPNTTGSADTGNSSNTGLTTTKPSENDTTTTKPSTNPPTQPTKPTDTTKPTEKPTEKPTTPPTKPTEPPTQKPTEPPTERSENIDYFVQYAINYGKSIGLTYRTDVDKETGGWDTPIVMRTPVKGNDIGYYEDQIKGYLNGIKREGFSNFWVQKENRNGAAARYNLYIGYCV